MAVGEQGCPETEENPPASDTNKVPPTSPKPEGAKSAPNGVFTDDSVASLPTAPLDLKTSTDPTVVVPWFVTSTPPPNDPNLGARTGCVHTESACDAYRVTLKLASIVLACAVPLFLTPTTRNWPPTEPKFAGKMRPPRRL